ncbi:ehrabx6d protein, putative [Entamoeba dispar SAW760]|uniref:Ehrabx6d protein, putative n=1 Tax=Entamoeba dispar (strain ATCC PRA-260 / SAW760) TaxID=370354 RepID=B0EI78_ENTDS|nr:ehrabx6d protein, putative [Entamoeba dispar SAW760]EDR25761.1 ehrabx6d protein, putative [Entamoeba dispar SAW760]|eukprot:EDR25761.1 ehrabx6d protein, putative [Entamoeba dispar SAW760]
MSRPPAKNKKISIAFCGNSAVGKTALFTRITKGISSISADVFTKQVNVDGQNHNVALWDTAGQEKFRSTTKSYLRGLHGVLFCFDITKKETFNCIDMWIQEYEQAQTLKDLAARYLIGCKGDLASKREVSIEDAENYAKSKNMTYLECSAKTGDNVDNLLASVIRSFKQKNPSLVTLGIMRPSVSDSSATTLSSSSTTTAPISVQPKEEEPITLAKPHSSNNEPQEAGGCC